MKTRSYNFFSNPLKAGLTAGISASLFTILLLLVYAVCLMLFSDVINSPSNFLIYTKGVLFVLSLFALVVSGLILIFFFQPGSHSLKKVIVYGQAFGTSLLTVFFLMLLFNLLFTFTNISIYLIEGKDLSLLLFLY